MKKEQIATILFSSIKMFGVGLVDDLICLSKTLRIYDRQINESRKENKARKVDVSPSNFKQRATVASHCRTRSEILMGLYDIERPI